MPSRLWILGILFALLSCVSAYEVAISDKDYSRQICSGMWSSQSTYINVTFEPSQGQLAMVIYEWSDVEYLGKVTSAVNDELPKTYICTTSAVQGGFCTQSQLGQFILDLPQGKSATDTSFWTAKIAFSLSAANVSSDSSTGLWDNPDGNPPIPDEEHTTPFRRSSSNFNIQRQSQADGLNPSPSGTLIYNEPIQYFVRKTGYYCVAIVPVTVLSAARQDSEDVAHPAYNGKVLFQNKFQGQLPAADYPKTTFYMCLFFAYLVIGSAWAWLCYQNIHDLLPIQYYLSSLVGFLIIEMIASWTYYRYLNAHGRGTTSTVFLFVVAILDAGRNALSFFMLLVVSLGLSVVRESLGRLMLRCQLLAGAHFVFGVLYAVGIVELELESTSALILLIFVIPLAFTLSGFLLWILYSLNATIAQLRARKQSYKLSMFTKLYRILLAAVVIIGIFFVISSLSFSDRLAEDYAAKSWKVRWWLLDGYLALLYLVSFTSIAYLWRPTPNNRRLAMSDELAQDDEDAEDYDLEALEHRTRVRDDDDDEDEDGATLVGRRGPGSVGEDQVVFEIGDEDAGSDDEDSPVKKSRGHNGNAGRHGGPEERAGLIGSDEDD